PVRSAIGIRLPPRSLRQAPRFWARASLREPRDPGLPFRLAPGIANELRSRKQKTLRSSRAREGPCERTIDFALSEIAPLSHACAIDRPQAVRQSGKFFQPVLHRVTHVLSRTECPRRLGQIRLILANVNGKKKPGLKKPLKRWERSPLSRTP